MLEILKFIFSSFWVWLGTLILVAVMLQGMMLGVLLVVKAARPMVVKAARPKRRRLKSITRIVRHREGKKTSQWPTEIDTLPASND